MDEFTQLPKPMSWMTVAAVVLIFAGWMISAMKKSIGADDVAAELPIPTRNSQRRWKACWPKNPNMPGRPTGALLRVRPAGEARKFLPIGDGIGLALSLAEC